MPRVIAALMASIAVASIVATVAQRSGAAALFSSGVLSVSAVWQGQIWRLATYWALEPSPLSLIFSCLTLYWFGAELAARWGPRQFLRVFLGLAIGIAAVTCGIGRAWRDVAATFHAGSAPVLDGLIVAWGVVFRTRQLRLFGLLRMTGRWLVPITIGVTLLFALYYGFAGFIPHFVAELSVLLALAVLLPWRARRHTARMAAAARGEAWSFEAWYARERRRKP